MPNDFTPTDWITTAEAAEGRAMRENATWQGDVAFTRPAAP
jgi:hypothetical protein